MSTVLPTFGSYQTNQSIATQGAQAVNQFSSWFSNTPGQTVQHIFNTLVLLRKLTQWTITHNVSGTVTNTSFPVDCTDNCATYQTWAQWMLAVVLKCIKASKTNFYNNPTWSCNAPPYRGWASEGSVNTYNTVINPYLDTIITSSNSTDIGRIIYYYVYAFAIELANPDLQINRYTFKFVTNVAVSAPNYDNTSIVTQTMSEWFNNADVQTGLLSFTEGFLTVADPSFALTGTPNSQYSIAPYITQLLTSCPTCTVEVVDRTPLYFLIAPLTTSSSDGNSITLLSYSIQYSIELFLILSGLLYNIIISIESALTRSQNLTDSYGTPVFQEAAMFMTEAAGAFTLLITLINDSIVSSNASLSAVSAPKYWQLLSYTTPSPRIGSCDINRIPGSIIPTLQFCYHMCEVIYTLSGPGYIQSTDPIDWKTLYVCDFQCAVVKVHGSGDIGASCTCSYPPMTPDITIVQSLIQQTIDSLASQTDVHYGRWNQNLNAI